MFAADHNLVAGASQAKDMLGKYLSIARPILNPKTRRQILRGAFDPCFLICLAPRTNINGLARINIACNRLPVISLGGAAMQERIQSLSLCVVSPQVNLNFEFQKRCLQRKCPDEDYPPRPGTRPQEFRCAAIKKLAEILSPTRHSIRTAPRRRSPKDESSLQADRFPCRESRIRRRMRA